MNLPSLSLRISLVSFVKVVDEAGMPLPYGTPGELWVRGYCNMRCYWDDETNTRKSLTEDGWLKTADQFILYENGYGSIVGRLKDMIIRGGENIFPKVTLYSECVSVY